MGLKNKEIIYITKEEYYGDCTYCKSFSTELRFIFEDHLKKYSPDFLDPICICRFCIEKFSEEGVIFKEINV